MLLKSQVVGFPTASTSFSAIIHMIELDGLFELIDGMGKGNFLIVI